jgi:ribosomal protein S18 acetylase RimI-like enzyme
MGCSLMGEISIGIATPGDIESIVTALTAARDDQVATNLPPAWSRIRSSRVTQGVSDHAVHVVRMSDSDKVIGTIEIRDSDEEVWGVQPPDALYVHRLAVMPEYQRQGIASQLLATAEQMAGASEKQFLRLDVVTVAASVREWYERRGFVQRGEVQPADYGRPSMRYEKRLGADPHAAENG